MPLPAIESASGGDATGVISVLPREYSNAGGCSTGLELHELPVGVGGMISTLTGTAGSESDASRACAACSPTAPSSAASFDGKERRNGTTLKSGSSISGALATDGGSVDKLRIVRCGRCDPVVLFGRPCCGGMADDADANDIDEVLKRMSGMLLVRWRSMALATRSRSRMPALLRGELGAVELAECANERDTDGANSIPPLTVVPDCWR